MHEGGVGRSHSHPKPLVVQYLYVHGHDEAFYYPTARSPGSAAGVAVRYLECALVQAASLRFRDVDCDLALATNIADPRALGRAGAELIRSLEALGVALLATEYRHRPGDDSVMYLSSRYVFDAILAAAEGQPEDRLLVLTDLDCVWVDAERLFAAVCGPPAISCIYMPYGADWDAVGFGELGRTAAALGTLAHGLGGSEQPPPWVGGELLAGSPSALRELVASCDELDALLKDKGQVVPAEEQILTLAGALGKVRYDDLSPVARRVHTGPRHGAPPTADPLSLCLWHLPGEKGLSFRRAAAEVRRRRTRRLRRDFSEPSRMARRFNVAGTGLGRRLRDDGWLVGRRVSGAVRPRLPSRAVTPRDPTAR